MCSSWCAAAKSSRLQHDCVSDGGLCSYELWLYAVMLLAHSVAQQHILTPTWTALQLLIAL
jgi:hypothetical protein